MIYYFFESFLPSKTAMGASFVGSNSISILVRIERNPGFIFTGSRGINCGTISFNVLSKKNTNNRLKKYQRFTYKSLKQVLLIFHVDVFFVLPMKMNFQENKKFFFYFYFSSKHKTTISRNSNSCTNCTSNYC